MKKYELTAETIEFRGVKLHRIRALISFNDVKTGDLGGYIEKEDNLSQEGNCWVYDEAKVYGNARVYGNANVWGNAMVYDNAKVSSNACVCSDARVYVNAGVCGNAWVCGNADYSTITGFGPVYITTTFFKQVDGSIGVSYGRLCVTLDEFRTKVKEAQGVGKYAKEYLMLADLMEMHFKED